MSDPRPITYMLTFECSQETLRMVEEFDATVVDHKTFGSRNEWLKYVVETAIEQYKESGYFFPQDNNETIDQLIDDINEMQSTVDAVDNELEELRQTAERIRSKPLT